LKPRFNSLVSRAVIVSLATFMLLTGAPFNSNLFVQKMIPDAKAAVSECTTSNATSNLSAEPSHAKTFFIDTGLSPRLDASYIGYRIKNASSTSVAGHWVSLESFNGGVVELANPRDTFQQLPTIPAGQTRTVYFLVKANTSTRVSQSHNVVIYNARPDASGTQKIHECSFAFTRVMETIKAAANKVTSITVSNSNPAIGDLVTFTVSGQTGTIGAGPAGVGRILWFTPNAYSNFPTQSLRLESATLLVSTNNGFPANSTRRYVDRLFVDPTIFPETLSGTATDGTVDSLTGKRNYRNTYTFRVLGRTSSNVPVTPIGQISSGTQIKHTDPSVAGGTFSLNLTSAPINVSVNKDVVSQDTFTKSGDYLEVPFKVTLRSSAGTAVLDKVVDTPANGVLFKAGSAKFNGSTIADPVFLAGESALTPRPLHFIGPFDVTTTNRDLTYTMLVPIGGGPYENTAVAYIGDQLVGSWNFNHFKSYHFEHHN
jgi:hypothetical protein